MNGTYSLPSAPPAREANRDIIFMMLPLLVVACYLYGGRPAVMCPWPRLWCATTSRHGCAAARTILPRIPAFPWRLSPP